MISDKIVKNLSSSSWIRAMFEEGEKLRQTYGADKVFDFSLGNPDIKPPEVVKESLKKLILEDSPKLHSYMSNAGYTDVRACIAGQLKKETGASLTYEHIVMTCGAGGALNVVLKTILNPSEEVIIFAPYFVEYLFYIDNHGGKAVVVSTDPATFEPDPETLCRNITPQTKAIIINSPNNPTGVVYSEETLKKIASILESKEKEYGTTIFVISDEPYTKIVYDGIKVPSVLKIFKNSIVVDSFSKSLSLPGERIGYIAANPAIESVDMLMSGLIFANRTLGFVNAPALFQRIIPDALNALVDVKEYQKKRDLLYNNLVRMGFTCIKPSGAFYLFPESLIPDDVEFTKCAMKYNLILVPGKGFGCPGHFRIAYCVSISTIERSLPAFKALAAEFKCG